MLQKHMPTSTAPELPLLVSAKLLQDCVGVVCAASTAEVCFQQLPSWCLGKQMQSCIFDCALSVHSVMLITAGRLEVRPAHHAIACIVLHRVTLLFSSTSSTSTSSNMNTRFCASWHTWLMQQGCCLSGSALLQVWGRQHEDHCGAGCAVPQCARGQPGSHAEGAPLSKVSHQILILSQEYSQISVLASLNLNFMQSLAHMW